MSIYREPAKVGCFRCKCDECLRVDRVVLDVLRDYRASLKEGRPPTSWTWYVSVLAGGLLGVVFTFLMFLVGR